MTAKNAYVNAHERIRRRRGKASAQECVRCGGQAYDWAYNNDSPDPDAITDQAGRVYSNDPAFYIPMCRTCHRKFDEAHAKPNCPKGHPYNGENLVIEHDGTRRCRECRNQYQRDLRKNPEHQAKERQRSQKRTAARAKKPPRPEVTHCPQGHAYEGYNLIVDRGKKKCRECGRARARRYYHENKAAA